ncbi:MAG: anthranilate phosphoribosyltransferase [Planctomycetota bacterium]|nr:anthranilate phosphoribosyltransferase [Planctomycetota bacterium]
MKHLLAILVAGKTLGVEQAVEAFELIMTGQASPAQIGALLAMIQIRGPHVDEITGAAKVMRAHVAKVEIPSGLRVIDTCGTGGDHANTFNISTASAIVAAGAGRPRGVAVAKHGNRSVTSKSGSSQVLEVLGVKLEASPATLTRCLDRAGICFCFAPSHHPAVKHVAPARQELGFRTLFNILGPLTNPAGATRQVMGVFAPELTEPLATVLLRTGTEHAMVVHGQLPDGSGLDELTTTGPSRVSHVQRGAMKTYTLEATSLGLARVEPESLRVDGPEASAAVIRRVLAGEPGPARDIVCLNAAAAMVVADLATDLTQGLALVRKSIDSGDAGRALDALVAITRADST